MRSSRNIVSGFLVALFVLIFCISKVGAESKSYSSFKVVEEIIRIPYDWSWELETTIYRPEGKGPFPLLLINHGKSWGDAREQQRYQPYNVSKEFVKRGYVVAIPMRLGFAKSDGIYKQTGCDLTKDGYSQSESVSAAMNYLVGQDYVDKKKILMAGFSYGGMVSLAYAAGSPVEGLRGVLNFSGGIKKASGSCLWDISLSKAFQQFGQKSQVPSLWVYAENDSFFSVLQIKKFYAEYVGNKQHAELLLLPSFKDDGHRIFNDLDGIPQWWPEASMFLKKINMPY